MTDLVEAAATELEDLRQPPRSKLCRAASMSPPNVPLCEESSLSDTSDSDTEGGGSATPPGVEKARRGYRRRNTVAVPGEKQPNAGSCPGQRFPPNCLKLVRSLPGNSRCVDCGEMNPEWGSVSYGALLCLRCSGRHRGLGVNNSVVRSIAMDGWSHSQVLSMLEGGNDQLSGFFVRHSLSPRAGGGDAEVAAAEVAAAAAAAAAVQKKPELVARSNSCCSGVDEIVAKRYKTKAALFYRENLAKHVERVAADGKYKGREAARKRTPRTSSSSKGSPKSKSSSPDEERKSKALKSADDTRSCERPPIPADAAKC